MKDEKPLIDYSELYCSDFDHEACSACDVYLNEARYGTLKFDFVVDVWVLIPANGQPVTGYYTSLKRTEEAVNRRLQRSYRRTQAMCR